MESSLTESVRSYALSLGFSAMGVAPTHILKQDEVALKRWLDLGYQGDMEYMARAPHRRTRPQEVLPGAQSVIVLATNYYPGDPPEKPFASIPARVSRYAWGRDYHRVIEGRLKQLEGFIKLKGDPNVKCRSYVDHGPVLEKSLARDAGLGFIGKNTLLITESFGSWVFLSVILTTLALTPGQPKTSQCGSCRLCLDACPTDAFTAPFVLDARRCISYLTIENKNEIPDRLKSRMGNWIFGCDICQEVCPYNARPTVTKLYEFRADQGAGPALDPEEILDFKSDESFKMRFRRTPLLRPKRSGIQRNAKVVSRNDRRASVKGEQV
jgi:epoxyqueuosine reductase